MLLNRDYVGHMASEVIKKLLVDNQVEIKEKDQETVITRVRQRMMEEITVEDKVNEEVRNILTQYQKVKGQIARDRKLILR
jgi:ribosomal protein S13